MLFKETIERNWKKKKRRRLAAGVLIETREGRMAVGAGRKERSVARGSSLEGKDYKTVYVCVCIYYIRRWWIIQKNKGRKEKKGQTASWSKRTCRGRDIQCSAGFLDGIQIESTQTSQNKKCLERDFYIVLVEPMEIERSANSTQQPKWRVRRDGR